MFFLIIFLILLFILVCFFIVTNPTNRFTIVKNPFDVTYSSGKFTIQKRFDIQVQKGFWKYIAYAKCAFHIGANVYFGSKKAKGENANEIIKEIHLYRFNSNEAYLISGDHFSVQYPRNLGVFYHCLLDSGIDSTEEDWIQRQKIYLKTIAYDLETFTQNGDVSTTIVPLGSKSAACINIYAYPSDSLYGILFGLETLLFKNRDNIYHLKQNQRSLYTNDAAKYLLLLYKEKLINLIDKYYSTVFDGSTGLIKKSLHLSGAKDITMRHSSFYDNVVLWKIMKLSNELNLKIFSDSIIEDYRQHIITAFWLKKEGYFIEDLSAESINNNYYSSDWLVVLFTEFISPDNKQELHYFERSVEYIQKEKIDKPFGLKYQQTDRKKRQFPLVRFFVPSYGGSSIWSFWGCEYIKLLIILYTQTNNKKYLTVADEQINSYKNNIEKYKGFPELYNDDGTMLSGLFYKSIRQTGWVINYEQAIEMRKLIVG